MSRSLERMSSFAIAPTTPSLQSPSTMLSLNSPSMGPYSNPVATPSFYTPRLSVKSEPDEDDFALASDMVYVYTPSQTGVQHANAPLHIVPSAPPHRALTSPSREQVYLTCRKRSPGPVHTCPVVDECCFHQRQHWPQARGDQELRA
jgi:hypothetical protein